MHAVKEFGADRAWWALPAAIVLVVVALTLASTGWHSPARDWRERMALLPGLTIENDPSPRNGVIVTSLQSGSEAAVSGIKVGDGIGALDGRSIGGVADAARYLKNDRKTSVVLHVAHGPSARNVRLHRVREARHGA